ncbi:hypothetical protein [Candidatus Harpocratesius sp.]
MFEALGWQKAKLLIIQGASFGTGLGFLLMGIFDTCWVVVFSNKYFLRAMCRYNFHCFND